MFFYLLTHLEGSQVPYCTQFTNASSEVKQSMSMMHALSENFKKILQRISTVEKVKLLPKESSQCSM